MTLEDLKKIVEVYSEFENINTTKRTDDYVEARWIYFKLAKLHTNKSLASIGALVRRDHASVIHGLKQFESYGHDLKYMKGVFNLCELEISNITNHVATEFNESVSFTEKIKRLESTTSELMKTVNALINGLPVEYQTIEI